MQQLTKNVIGLLYKHNLPVAENWIQSNIESHPDFPSLLCIYEVLNIAGIKCVIHKIDNEDLSNISFPVLLHLHDEDLALVTNAVELEHFDKNLWTGVILNISKVETELNDSYQNALKIKKQQANLKSLLFFGFVLSFSFINIINQNFDKFFLSLTSLLGLYIGWQLFLKETGSASKWVDKACRTVGNGCDKVLNSKIADGISGIKPVDAVIYYFAIMLFSNLFIPTTSLEKLILLFALPITLFSLYYQKFIIKGWCVLCLAVSMIIWIQFGFVFRQGFQIDFPTANSVLYFIIGLMICLSWFPFKTFYFQKIAQKEESINALRLNRNPSVFNFLLRQQKQVFIPNWEDGMTFHKNDYSPINITVVCQPYCVPCSKAHEQLNELVKCFPHDIYLNIKWLSGNEKADKILKILFGMVEEENGEEGFTIIEKWFELMDIDKFVAFYDDKIIDENSDWIEKHNNWTKLNHVEFTPSIFINSRQMPPEYSIEDLKIILPSMIEEIKENSNVALEIA
jgi:Vitamin K epoxide reductase family